MQKNKKLFRLLASLLVLFLLIGLPSQMVQAEYDAQNNESCQAEFVKGTIAHSAFPRNGITQGTLAQSLLIQDDYANSSLNCCESCRNESTQDALSPSVFSASIHEHEAHTEDTPNAYSATVSYFDGPTGGWGLRDRPNIRGNKKFTYAFESSSLSSMLSKYLVDGAAMWGDEISLTKASSSANAGIIIKSASTNQSVAVDSKISASNGKITGATILVNIEAFVGLTDAQRVRAMARELGRAYGLGYVQSSTPCIMNITLSSNASVTNMDKCGIRYVTGAHTVHSYGTWMDSGSTYHTRVCTMCHGVLHESHTVNSAGNCPICGHEGPITAPLLN